MRAKANLKLAVVTECLGQPSSTGLSVYRSTKSLRIKMFVDRSLRLTSSRSLATSTAEVPPGKTENMALQ